LVLIGSILITFEGFMNFVRLHKFYRPFFLATSSFVIGDAWAGNAGNVANAELAKQIGDAVLKVMDTAAAPIQNTGSIVPWVAAPDRLLYLLIATIVVGMVIVLIWIRNGLVKSGWSLSDALSEEVMLPVFKESIDANGKTSKVQVFDADNKAILAPELRGSTSRLIALMGMVAILILFICFGAVAIFAFGKTGSIPAGVEKIVGFLMTGTTLFAPYALNKLISVFQAGPVGK
jgi:hypothetical protein